MQEIFKDIPGLTGYQVSNVGTVRSLERDVICNGKNNSYARHLPECTLKQSSTNDGYKYVSIHSTRYLVHRLVYTAFNPNINIDYLDINHIDRNRANNNINNLEAITHLQNLIEPERIKQFIQTKTGMKYHKKVDVLALYKKVNDDINDFINEQLNQTVTD